MSLPEREDDHASGAPALLTDAFKGRDNIVGLLQALCAPWDDLEDTMWDVLEGRVLGTATGVWLDYLGAIVGERREGRDDTSFEAAIRVRIRVNRSQGRAVDVIDVANLLDATSTYVEYYPLAWEVSIYNVTSSPTIVRLLGQAKAASSYGILLTSTWPEATVFKFDHAGTGTNVFGSDAGSDTLLFPAALTTNPTYRRFTG